MTNVTAKEVTTQETTKVNTTAGFICLGYNAEYNFIWSNFKNCIFKLTPKDFNENVLKNILGSEFIFFNYEERKEKKQTKAQIKAGEEPEITSYTNYRKLTDEIIDGCQKAGVYNIENQRGAGTWLDQEGHLVVNSGEIFSTNPKFNGSRIQKNGVYVFTKDLGITSKTPAATKEEIQKLWGLVSSFNFSRGIQDSRLLLGGIGQAYLAGAVKDRAPFYLNAPAGSGKTTCQRMLTKLFGKNTVSTDGDSSEAGIRQAVRINACTVQVDEAEAEQSKIMKTLTMFRSAFSGSSVLKGTADQSGTEFTLRFCGFLTGIVKVELNQADTSRFICLDLNPFTAEHKAAISKDISELFYDDEKLEELGLKVHMFMVQNFATLTKINAIIRKILLLGNSERYADTFGSILGSSYLMLDGEVNEEKITKYVSEFDFTQEQEKAKFKDHDQLLSIMLTKEVADFDGKNKFTVLSYIYSAYYQFKQRDFKAFKDCNSILGKFGIRVLDEDNLSIIIDPYREGLKSLLNGPKGEKFKNGDIGNMLLRIENAARLKEAKSIGGIQERGYIKIELDQEKYNYTKFAQLLEDPKPTLKRVA